MTNKKIRNPLHFYRTTFDPMVARLYNNVAQGGKCRHCHGKGDVVSHIPQGDATSLINGEPFDKVHAYCQCVQKNIKDQLRDEQ